jgi:hypothetical protein
MEHNVLPMVQRLPRTPGLLGENGERFAAERNSRGGDYLNARGGGERQQLTRGNSYGSREGSVLSQLSSEIGSAENEEQEEEVGGEGSEVACKNCGNTTFKATVGTRGHRLRCRNCGTAM